MGSEMRKWSVRFVVVMGALLLLAFIADQIWASALAHEFEQRIEELRAAGEPIDFEDLAGPPVPDDQNAAPLLIRAWKWYEDTDESWIEKNSDDWGRERWSFVPEVVSNDVAVVQWSEEDRKAVRAYVKECAVFLELLERASQRPACRFELEYDKYGLMPVPPIGFAVATAHVLWARALVAVSRENGSAEVERSAHLFMFLGDIQEPAARSYDLRLVMYGKAMGVVQEASTLDGFDARVVRRALEPRITLASDPRALTAAMRGARVWGLWCVRRLVDGDDVSVPEWLRAVRAPRRGRAYQDALVFLDVWEEALKWAEAQKVQRHLSLPPQTTDLPVWGFLGHRPESLVERRRRHVARIRLGRVALAVLAHKQETGVWAPSLEQVARRFESGLPLDPFTGEPFVYERASGGVRLSLKDPYFGSHWVEDWELEDDGRVWNLRDG